MRIFLESGRLLREQTAMLNHIYLEQFVQDLLLEQGDNQKK